MIKTRFVHIPKMKSKMDKIDEESEKNVHIIGFHLTLSLIKKENNFVVFFVLILFNIFLGEIQFYEFPFRKDDDDD